MIATDKSIRFTPWDPVVAVEKREMRSCGDYLPGAKSVIVFGLRYSKEVLRWATRPPAEAVGPYAFQTYVTNWMASILGFRIVKHLENFGYRAALAPDLMNTASWTANPRGLQRDLFSNRFEGVAAGLGYLTTSGHLATPDFGIRQRIMAIVTDAPLDASPLYRPSKKEILCGDCKEMCITTCPSQAIGKQEMGFELEGIKYSMNRIDAKLCDWTKRYVMTGESGFKYLGSKVDLKPGKTVTPESLSAGLKLHDPIKKYRPVVAEPCVINCPYGNADAGAR